MQRDLEIPGADDAAGHRFCKGFATATAGAGCPEQAARRSGLGGAAPEEVNVPRGRGGIMVTDRAFRVVRPRRVVSAEPGSAPDPTR